MIRKLLDIGMYLTAFFILISMSEEDQQANKVRILVFIIVVLLFERLNFRK
jgi:hypothetical protein